MWTLYMLCERRETPSRERVQNGHQEYARRRAVEWFNLQTQSIPRRATQPPQKGTVLQCARDGVKRDVLRSSRHWTEPPDGVERGCIIPSHRVHCLYGQRLRRGRLDRQAPETSGPRAARRARRHRCRRARGRQPTMRRAPPQQRSRTSCLRHAVDGKARPRLQNECARDVPGLK